MPQTHEKWTWNDPAFIDEAFYYLRRISPSLSKDDIIDVKVNRLRYAQPVCEPNFRDRLPPIQTPIAGFQAADTSYYYPEDRGIAESIRLGRAMTEAIEPSTCQ